MKKSFSQDLQPRIHHNIQDENFQKLNIYANLSEAHFDFRDITILTLGISALKNLHFDIHDPCEHSRFFGIMSLISSL